MLHSYFSRRTTAQLPHQACGQTRAGRSSNISPGRVVEQSRRSASPSCRERGRTTTDIGPFSPTCIPPQTEHSRHTRQQRSTRAHQRKWPNTAWKDHVPHGRCQGKLHKGRPRMDLARYIQHHLCCGSGLEGHAHSVPADPYCCSTFHRRQE